MNPAESKFRAYLGTNPWWIPPYLLGRVPKEVDRHALVVLGLVTFAQFIENYDVSLLGNALKFIREDLDIAESDLGYFQTLIRLGALPAFLLLPFADKYGRRPLFLVSLVGLSLGTLATAFSQTATQFVMCQSVVRTFVISASAVSIVIIIEELPASARGWGIGMLGAVSAVGHGLGAAAFAAIEILPYGWRSLYAFGLLPLLLLPFYRRGLKETQRFRNLSSEDTDLRWWRPVVAFGRQYPARAARMILVASLASLGYAVTFSFTGYYVLEYQGWAPHELSLMVLVAGAVSIVGNVVAGHLADRIGRRWVGFGFLAVFPATAWFFYNGSGAVLPILWTLLTFTIMGGLVVIRALSSELFPTAQRGTSTGVLMLMETVGAAFGLFLLGTLQQAGGNLIALIPWIATVNFAAALVLLLVPETRLQELEAISDDGEESQANR